MIKQFDRKITDDTALLLSSACCEHIVFSFAAVFIRSVWNAVGSDSNQSCKKDYVFVSDNVAQSSFLLSSSIISFSTSIRFLPRFHSFFPRWLYFRSFEF